VSEEIVNALLEGDEVPDPKYFSDRVPTMYDEAISWASAKFHEEVNDGLINGPKSADERAAEIATDAVHLFSLAGDEDDEAWETIVTPLFKLAGEMFPDQQ
jgi:hypothetical protein